MTDDRPVLVGMNNPLSDDPRYALAPFPEGCTGHRLYTMLSEAAQAEGRPLVGTGAFRKSYMGRFDRRNVLHARQWSKSEARAAGVALCRQLAGRRVVVVGVATLEALGLPRPHDWCVWVESEARAPLLPILPIEDVSLEYCLIPHASGRCREYNDPGMRRRVGCLLLDVYTGAVGG